MLATAGRLDNRGSELVAEYFPLAKAIARQTHSRLPRGVDFDDLVSAAVMGLMDAVDRFDPARGIAFKSYAKHRILGSVLDSLRASDWVPRAVRRRAESLNRARALLRTRLGREPTKTELAANLEIELSALEELCRDADPQPLLSLDAPVEENGSALRDRVADEGNPELALQERQRKELLVAAIELLPERERVAIVLFYFREVPLKDIGAVLGVTESRACQLCSQAIRRMQSRLLAAAAA